jgi:predicted O-linked N-acetylglucosamine transferase (SPINDLY family)
VGLACALLDLRRPEECVESYRRGLALSPHQPVYHSDLIFALNFVSNSNTAAQQAERSEWYNRHALALTTTTPLNRSPKRRLRIGYVSAHFCHQAATYAFGAVLANHNPDSFEIFCYSDTPKEDDLTNFLRSCASKWQSTSQLSDERLAALIRADQIDVLVDLVGHMQGHRLLTFARKPAPVQITAWGEPTGTGLKTMDYLFTDPILVPADERSLFAERIFDLPCGLAFWSPDRLPDVGPLPAMTRPGITFGSFNRLQKLTRPVIDAWAEILRNAPDSRIVLKEFASGSGLVENFASQGVDPQRVVFKKRSARWEHFTALNEIDIALDPFPHSGGMTTLDALWMGVPVVTCPGRTVSSRLATSCNTAVGLEDFVARNLEDYIRIALAKASDLNSLAAVRCAVRGRMLATPVGDPKRYANAVEEAYRSIWHQ